ncbi:ABC transporter permease [Halorhabdus amylolytica]|uniref:ABC transporter permease n=1 Tax=Halorhabdus amylolytica TaxID=2559573 RepID=UPI001B7D8C10|nr:ABC transporter permease [Halorhabdus amylolytica]
MSDRQYPAPVQRFLRFFVGNSVVERILISAAALVTAIIVSSIIVLVAGYLSGEAYNPIEIFAVLVNGAFGSPFALDSARLFTEGWSPVNFSMGTTLKETTLLIFAGLAVAVAFRGDLFNIGVQGQLVLGGLAAALALVWVAPFVPGGLVGTLLLIPFGLLVGAIVGGLYGAIPGALKAYADANEVITTIMLNTIATGTAFFLVSAYFADPTLQSVKTRPIPDFARLNGIVFPQGGQFSLVALVLALLATVAVYYVLRYTSFGYDLRVSGKQAAAALYGGANAERMVVSTMTLSGALGGIAGAMWSMMVIGAWRQGVPSVGFDGITVSVLAGNNPIGVIPAALLFGVLKGGSNAINFQLGVPPELVAVLRGMIILFIAMPEAFRMLGNRLGIKPDPASAATGGGGNE